MQKKLVAHKIADCFEWIGDEDLKKLGNDIEKYGLNDDIVLLDGKILEGRNRYRACVTRGLPFATVHFEDLVKTKRYKTYLNDPIGFVLSKNERRRHSSETSKATTAAKLIQESHGVGTPMTYAQAADALGVSERLIYDAAKVLGHAVPQLVDAMKNGHVTATAAGQAADLPPAAQCAVAREAEEGGTAAAAKEVQEQQSTLIERKGCELLKQAVAEGIISKAKALKIAAEPANAQVEMVRDLLEKHAADMDRKARIAAEKAVIDAEEKTKVDAEGHEVTVACMQAFTTVEMFAAADTLVRKLQTLLKEMAILPGGEQLRMQLKAMTSGDTTVHRSDELEALKRTLKFTRPHSICPQCSGKAAKGCKGCTGCGWVSQTTWKDMEDDLKAKLEK